jgi:hypothetical protein
MNPICVICKLQCENVYGNNPSPMVNDSTSKCCDKCNRSIVIPSRIMYAMKPDEFEKIQKNEKKKKQFIRYLKKLHSDN